MLNKCGIIIIPSNKCDLEKANTIASFQNYIIKIAAKRIH